MGRWFGYRDGYADLCRLWTSQESADWYMHISEATEELRYDIRSMAAQNRKPIDFGLRVRSAEDTPLIVTARNKMKATDTITLTRQLNGQTIETPVLTSDLQEAEANMRIAEEWLNTIDDYRVTDTSMLALSKKPTYSEIPKAKIIDLVRRLTFPPVSELSEDSAIINSIEQSDDQLLEVWDVVVATQNSETAESVQFGPVKITPHRRSFSVYGSHSNIRMSGSSSRLGTRDYGKGGLTQEAVKHIEDQIKKTVQTDNRRNNFSENSYFSTGINRNPLLVIYPIKLKESKVGNQIINDIVARFKKHSLLDVGVSLGIPDIEGKQTMRYEYVINAVYNRAFIEGTDDQNQWDELEEESEVDSGED